jgi:hypothetical protein
MRFLVRNAALWLALVSSGLCELPSSGCNVGNHSLVDCPYVSESKSKPIAAIESDATIAANSPYADDSAASAFLATPPANKAEKFHWRRALLESFIFLSIEQAYVVHDDYRWVTDENGIPFNHYWRDYKQSLSTWIHSGWNDGDPLLYGYLGHPIQGAMTEFIQIQNDPRGRDLELSNTKAYWHSRFRALLWNAVYSTQWNIGPLSELTVEKYGTQVRSPWNQNGTWPCTHKPCVTVRDRLIWL